MIIEQGELYDELMEMPDFIVINEREKYESIFKEISKISENASGKDELMLQSLILKLVYFLMRECEKAKRTDKIKNSNQKVIESVIRYIKENLTAELSLEKISAYAGFSPIHFHNCFKASTGKTLHEYVEEQRMKKAMDMLIYTEKTLTQIAYECGFSSQSYFSYAFKKKMKITPRRYALKKLSRYDE
jgi:AraC-like DNA-binding protein